MDELEERINEREKQVLKIIHAADYIAANISPRYGVLLQHFDDSGSMEVKDYCGYSIEIHGQPIVLPRNRGVNYRKYMVVKNWEDCDRGRYQAFSAEYKNSEENIVLKGIWEEKIAEFMKMADNPERYVKEYLDRKREEERSQEKWMREHLKEINRERRRNFLISRAKDLQVSVK